MVSQHNPCTVYYVKSSINKPFKHEKMVPCYREDIRNKMSAIKSVDSLTLC